jgi:hypothetical protein
MYPSYSTTSEQRTDNTLSCVYVHLTSLSPVVQSRILSQHPQSVILRTGSSTVVHLIVNIPHAPHQSRHIPVGIFSWSVDSTFSRCFCYPESIRPQRPRGLRSAVAWLLGSRVRIPPGACMFVCCINMLSCVGRGLCYGLITRPEESYRVSLCV